MTTNPSDLKERLRSTGSSLFRPDHPAALLMWEAAERISQLEQALELAANRLRAAAINEAPKGTREYYEYSEWADEAASSLGRK